MNKKIKNKRQYRQNNPKTIDINFLKLALSSNFNSYNKSLCKTSRN